MKDPADPHLFVVVVLPSQVFLIYWLNNQLLCLCLQARKAQGSLFFFPLVYLIMMIIILIKLVVIAVIISLISWFVICFQDCLIVFLIFGQFEMDWNIYSHNELAVHPILSFVIHLVCHFNEAIRSLKTPCF